MERDPERSLHFDPEAQEQLEQRGRRGRISARGEDPNEAEGSRQELQGSRTLHDHLKTHEEKFWIKAIIKQ